MTSRDELVKAATAIEARYAGLDKRVLTDAETASLLLARDVMRRGDQTKIDREWLDGLGGVRSGRAVQFNTEKDFIEVIEYQNCNYRVFVNDCGVLKRCTPTRGQLLQLLESLGWGGVE